MHGPNSTRHSSPSSSRPWGQQRLVVQVAGSMPPPWEALGSHWSTLVVLTAGVCRSMGAQSVCLSNKTCFLKAEKKKKKPVFPKGTVGNRWTFVPAGMESGLEAPERVRPRVFPAFRIPCCLLLKHFPPGEPAASPTAFQPSGRPSGQELESRTGALWNSLLQLTPAPNPWAPTFRPPAQAAALPTPRDML